MIRSSRLELSPGTETFAAGGNVVPLPFALPVYLTLREAGDMGPSGISRQERRDAVLRELNIDPARYTTLKQVHSRVVRTVCRGETLRDGTEGDGLLSNDPALALGVTVADCMPIFLAAPHKNVFGVLHSGWRGTGIVSEAIDLAESTYGVRPEELSVLLGPAIGSCCYRVDEQRAGEFALLWGEHTVVRTDGAPYLDLRTANLGLLEARGVGEISVIDECTVCNEALGSFRREGPTGFTRMMAVISGGAGL